MALGDQLEMMGREGAEFANAVFDRVAEKRALREAEAQRFQVGAPGWEGWDEAARLTATRDALMAELARLDPTNALLRQDVRTHIADAGMAEFIKGGRKALKDANVVTNGKIRLR